MSEKLSTVRQLYNLIRDGISAFFDPIAEALTRFGINPNVITSVGFLVSAISGYFFAAGMYRLGGAFILIAGIFDILDGKIARGSNRVTRFGALYDSTLDRYGEIFVFLGIAYYFIGHGHFSAAVAACVALGGSLMVSYVRARAEGLGLTCKVGLMQRPERILTIGFTALIHPWAMIVGMYFLAVFANFTAVQRLYHVWATENGKKHEVVPEYDKLG